MNKETIDLLEKAFQDAFAAGEARGTNPASLSWMTCWLLWRAMYIDAEKISESCTREVALPDSLGIPSLGE